VPKRTSATLPREKKALKVGGDDFLLLVLSVSDYKLDVLRQKSSEKNQSGGAEGKRWSRYLSRDQMGRARSSS